MLNFRNFMESDWTSRHNPTWFPLLNYERIHEGDNPPQRTAAGDYVVYHGTVIKNARKIFKERRIHHDDMGTVGITTHPSDAGSYGAMKVKKHNSPSTVLRLTIDHNWLDKQEISREVGGTGRNQFLIHVAEIPPEAIKDIQLARVSGTPLKGGSLEYPGGKNEV